MNQTVYDMTTWALTSGGVLLLPGLVLCVIGVLALTGYLWFLQGARLLAAAWIWRQAWQWWRAQGWPAWVATIHLGGRGGRRARHSALYERTMASAAWRRRRKAAIRRAGGRCQHCGREGPVNVHHTTYRDLGHERPWQLQVLCQQCHALVHERAS